MVCGESFLRKEGGGGGEGGGGTKRAHYPIIATWSGMS